jgi:hypothetical protein
MTFGITFSCFKQFFVDQGKMYDMSASQHGEIITPRQSAAIMTPGTSATIELEPATSWMETERSMTYEDHGAKKIAYDNVIVVVAPERI